MTEIFRDLLSAQKQMHKEMVEFGRIPEDVFNNSEYDDDDFGFGMYEGYSNVGLNHDNYDWRIVYIPE